MRKLSVGIILSVMVAWFVPAYGLAKSSTPATIYVVKKGDSLYAIGKKYRISVSQLKSINHLKSDRIYAGQKLIIRPSESARSKTTTYGYVKLKSGRLNVRKGPSTKYAVVGHLNNHQKVVLKEHKNGWYRIASGSLSGWVCDDYIITGGAANPAAKPAKPAKPSKPATPAQTTASGKSATKAGNKLKGKVIVLDPGHGGRDPGAVALDGSFEKIYNLSYTLAAKSALEKEGAKVVLTRSTDRACYSGTNRVLELQCRVDVAKKSHANLFISLHNNWSSNKSVRGTETHYNDRNSADYPGVNKYPKQSKALAQLVQKEVASAFGSKNRGVISDHLYVTRKNTVPAVLLEIGFLSNRTDLNKIRSASVKTKVANAIAKAVVEYYHS